MNKFFCSLLLLVSACATPPPASLSMVEINNKWVLVDQQQQVQYEVFFYDNGPDTPSDGLYRVVKEGKIGYADAVTNAVVIAPRYDCAFPFEQGRARVSNDCKTVQDGEYKIWESDAWQYINRENEIVNP